VSGPRAKREDPTRPPLLLVNGTATDEQVAALTAVLAAIAAGRTGGDTPAAPPSEWSSPGRAVHAPLRHGPGAWRASALPR